MISVCCYCHTVFIRAVSAILAADTKAHTAFTWILEDVRQ